MISQLTMHITLMFLQVYYWKKYLNGLSGSNVDVPFNSWTYADLSSASGGIEDQTTGSWQGVSRSVSLMGRVEYDFNEKYLASVTVRRDGSTSFGKNNKFAIFPSASVGWVASNEDFLILLLLIS